MAAILDEWASNWSSMGRRVYISVWVGVLAIWMQLLAPVVSLSIAQADVLPGVICSHAPQQADGSTKPQKQSQGDCCPFCHQHFGAALPTLDRPAFTRFDYPVVSPLRWLLADVGTVVVESSTTARPRGPPTLV